MKKRLEFNPDLQNDYLVLLKEAANSIKEETIILPEEMESLLYYVKMLSVYLHAKKQALNDKFGLAAKCDIEEAEAMEMIVDNIFYLLTIQQGKIVNNP